VVSEFALAFRNEQMTRYVPQRRTHTRILDSSPGNVLFHQAVPRTCQARILCRGRFDGGPDRTPGQKQPAHHENDGAV
jgi:hypothetical protein